MDAEKVTLKSMLRHWRDRWIGKKDARRVRIIRTDYGQTGRLTLGVIFAVCGLYNFGIGCKTMLSWYLKYHEFFWLSLLNVILSCCFVAIVIWQIYLYRRISRLLPTNKVSDRLGISVYELYCLMEARGIKPHYNIGGKDYYDIADFGDVSTLLRASAEPTAQPETLLRPASESSETPPETLLRATHSTPSAQEAPSFTVRKG
jgi:hypothetical protein